MLHNSFIFIAGGKDARGNGKDRSPLALRLAQRRNRRNYGTNRSQQTPSRLVSNCQFTFPFYVKLGHLYVFMEWKIALFPPPPISIYRKTLVWNFHSIFFNGDQFDSLKGRKHIIYATRSWSRKRLEKSQTKCLSSIV